MTEAEKIAAIMENLLKADEYMIDQVYEFLLDANLED